MPCVSIILTTYNHEKYIGRAIDSILNQTFTDYEVLIGDDSPNDNTWNVIKTYCKQNSGIIQARHHTENKWITRNMEFLINHAIWEYIAVLEWDDYRDKEYLFMKMEIFRNKNILLVYNDLNFVDKNWKIISQGVLKNLRNIRKLFKEEIFDLSKVLQLYIPPYHSRSTIMFKRDILQNINLSISWLSPYNIISDYNFFLMVWSNYPIYWIDKELTFYRIHDSNSSSLGDLDLVSDLYKLSLCYYKKGLINEYIFKNISTRYLWILVVWYLRKLFNISKKIAVKNFFILVSKKI